MKRIIVNRKQKRVVVTLHPGEVLIRYPGLPPISLVLRLDQAKALYPSLFSVF